MYNHGKTNEKGLVALGLTGRHTAARLQAQSDEGDEAVQEGILDSEDLREAEVAQAEQELDDLLFF